ncbi:MAG: LysR family transcriptional regulator [Rhodospirillaceae bacterium TMED8]|nr:LysR family transcriptional regulator [Magnetovibrio sp.]OUT52209.1 MAG: LysR family transcriptional regulator [Rhodospirillaceae bacterium TMED8]|tara:strand:- start:877 stop:1797 length:921 start_codon:yes stop_codon:yes gene_type:complete
MDWNQLRVFATVADVGSFTAAGKALGLSQSAVSRQIGGLERDLGVILFRRHASGIILSEPGAELKSAVEEMSSRLALATGQINEFRDTPEGPLRITTTAAFGSAWLSARMNRFIETYPDISVSLLLVDNLELDLCQGEADVAIRFQRPTQQNLVLRKLMSIRYHVFASSQYLEVNGTPENEEDLDNHRIIVYGDDVPAPIEDLNWLLMAGREDNEPRTPALQVNSVYGIYRAVLSGLGIAALPYYLSEESSNLSEILPTLQGPSIEAFFVYPEELRHSKRIAVLRDFLLDEVIASRKSRSSGSKRR